MDNCLPQIHGCRIRVAVLEAGTGVPLPGAEHLYVSSALTRVTTTPVYEDGTVLRDRNACDEVCLNYEGPPSFVGMDMSIELCTPDPYLTAMLVSGGVVLTDGDARGFGFPQIGVIDADAVSVEVWAKRINNGKIDADSPYAWWAYPWFTNRRIGEGSTENARRNTVVTGRLYENENWFDGPLNDWPVSSDRVGQWIPTDTLPDASCGYSALVAS
jgi:hypothetical protein